MPDLAKAADAIGTVHYSRFVVLSEKTLLFLADFDGEFEPLLESLARQAGPVFDAVLEHVENPPPKPVASNIAAFVKWAMDHTPDPMGVYTVYPTATVKEIKAQAESEGVAGTTIIPLNLSRTALGQNAVAAFLRGPLTSVRSRP
jgi:hypothetical protein